MFEPPLRSWYRITRQFIEVVLDVGIAISGCSRAVLWIGGVESMRPFPGVRHAVVVGVSGRRPCGEDRPGPSGADVIDVARDIHHVLHYPRVERVAEGFRRAHGGQNGGLELSGRDGGDRRRCEWGRSPELSLRGFGEVRTPVTLPVVQIEHAVTPVIGVLGKAIRTQVAFHEDFGSSPIRWGSVNAGGAAVFEPIDVGRAAVGTGDVMIVHDVAEGALVADIAAPVGGVVSAPVVDNVVAEIDDVGAPNQRIPASVVGQEAMVNRHGELLIGGPAADEDAQSIGGSHSVCEKVMPSKCRCSTGMSSCPTRRNTCVSRGATISAVFISSPGCGR